MATLSAALPDRLLIATGGPGTWTRRTALEGHRLECVAVDGRRPERVLVGTFEDGIHRSADGGETFERVGADSIDSEVVTAIAVDPHDPDRVWLGTEPSRVYRSTDGGAEWVHRPGLTDLESEREWSFPPRPHTHHVRWIEPDPTDEGRLYVGIEAGALVLTDDGGETWRERPEGSRRDNHSLATHPDAPGRVYAAAGDGYAESLDGGETWTHPQDGLEHRYCWSVVPDPGDPDRVLCSAASGAHAAHSQPATSYVYRRQGGEPWHRVGDGLPSGDGVTRAVLSATGPRTFYAASNRGVFRTTDGGATWDAREVGWPADADDTVRGFVAIRDE